MDLKGEYNEREAAADTVALADPPWLEEIPSGRLLDDRHGRGATSRRRPRADQERRCGRSRLRRRHKDVSCRAAILRRRDQR
jgi:hypothetical protein